MKGSPMKRNFGIGASPAKDTKEVAGFEHQHPHTEREQRIADVPGHIVPKVVDKDWEEKKRASMSERHGKEY